MAPRSEHPIHATFLFLALFISALLLLIVSVNTRYLETIEDLLHWVAKPIVLIAYLPQNTTDSIGDFFVSKQDLQSENEQLQKQLVRLNHAIAELDAANKKVEALTDALKYRDRIALNHLLAEIVRVDINQQRQEVTINLGEEHGVLVNTTVLDSFGVYGRVVDVLPETSIVMLIDDERHAIPVLLPRTGHYFIASGNGPNRPLTLDHVNLSDDIEVGDRLVSSGLAGVFPEGYEVGTVISVTDLVAESSKNVTVEPLAQLTKKSYLHALTPDVDDQ